MPTDAPGVVTKRWPWQKSPTWLWGENKKEKRKPWFTGLTPLGAHDKTLTAARKKFLLIGSKYGCPFSLIALAIIMVPFAHSGARKPH